MYGVWKIKLCLRSNVIHSLSAACVLLPLHELTELAANGAIAARSLLTSFSLITYLLVVDPYGIPLLCAIYKVRQSGNGLGYKGLGSSE